MVGYRTLKRHISWIKVGDTVLHNGQILTVNNNDIKEDSFMSWTLFGDSYMLGRKQVEVVEFAMA